MEEEREEEEGEEGERRRKRGRRRLAAGGNRSPRKDFCLSFPRHTLSIPKVANGFIWFLFEQRGEGEQLKEGLGRGKALT